MTIVAFDGKTLACDSKISGQDGAHWCSVKKIRRVDGWLIGAAGGWDMLTHFLTKFNPKCIENGLAYAPINPAPTKGDFDGLAISPKGEIYYIEDSGVFGKVKTKGFIAVGSGENIAMLSMDLGKTAREAVKLAIKYDMYCGGRVYSLNL